MNPEATTRWERLVRSASSAIVRDCYPEEVNLLPMILERFGDQIRDEGEGRAIGLPMMGKETGGARLPFVVMTVAAVLDELLDYTTPPDMQLVEEATRVAGIALGLDGDRLISTVDAVAPKLFTMFSLLAGVSEHYVTEQAQAPDSSVWVEWWMEGAGMQSESVDHDLLAEDHRSLRVELIVDEWSGEFQFGGFRKPISDCSPRGQVGIWLAMAHTGSHFTTSDILGLSSNPKWKTGPSALPKYIHEAKRFLKDLTGRSFISDAKQSRFQVDKDMWSWCWIRRDPKRLDSILLRQVRPLE